MREQERDEEGGGGRKVWQVVRRVENGAAIKNESPRRGAAPPGFFGPRVFLRHHLLLACPLAPAPSASPLRPLIWVKKQLSDVAPGDWIGVGGRVASYIGPHHASARACPTRLSFPVSAPASRYTDGRTKTHAGQEREGENNTPPIDINNADSVGREDGDASRPSSLLLT